MISDFQRLPQSKRVSQSLNGDLYFSNVRREDSRNDYICYARFPGTQTIQQKQPINVKVLNRKSPAEANRAHLRCDELTPERCTESDSVLRVTLVAFGAACGRKTGLPIWDPILRDAMGSPSN